MVSATRACAPPPTLSSVSASFFNAPCISCFFSFPSLFSFRLARSLLPFAFSRSFRSRALSLSGAPRLQVRRARAPVLGIRKSLICESFGYPLVNLEETKYFGPSRDGLNTPSFDVQYFFAPSLCALPWFLQLLRGAAEAAAGRGSPPPPVGGRGELVGLIWS